MPIKIQDEFYDQNDFFNFFSKYDSLKKSSENFFNHPIQPVNDYKSLYIEQGEYCIIDKNDSNFNFVGSDDATTCCIMFLENETTNKIIVAHIDSSIKLETIEEMFNLFLEANNENQIINCSLIGSYIDERNYSVCLLFKLLNFLNEIETTINLKLAFILELNTEKKLSKNNVLINFPKTLGACINLSTAEIKPCKFIIKEPELILRKARNHLKPKDLRLVYHSNDQKFIIEEFSYSMKVDLDFFIEADDEYLLKNFSTSPDTEPDDFVKTLRNVFIFISEKIENDQFEETKKEFKRDEKNLWNLVT